MNGSIEDKATRGAGATTRSGDATRADAATRGSSARASTRKPKQVEAGPTASVPQPDITKRPAEGVPTDSLCVPYDENLLERARTQWQFGDWENLARIDRETLQHHPDRAKLALLAAAAHLQTNDTVAARQLTRLAVDWGCGKRLVTQVLVAGVHNSLGRAAALAGQQARALEHFERAITTGSPASEVRLATRARTGEQFAQLGLQWTGLSEFPSSSTAVPQNAIVAAPSLGRAIDGLTRKVTEEVTAAVEADLKAKNPNPYVHNRTLPPALNKSLLHFAEHNLRRSGLKPAYIDYLGTKVIQIERNCVGRLATTIEDAIVRQLVAECIAGEKICILEIGALYGISLAILYNHATTRYREVRIVGLDPFDGFYGQAHDAVLNQPVNDLTFLRNMQLANVPARDFALIKHYSTDPVAVSMAQELPVNLIVIDGDHSYEGVKSDFDTYFPLLQPGGYVIFDDYNAKEWPGVQQFIDHDLQQAPGLEYLGAIGRTAVGRKRCADVQ